MIEGVKVAIERGSGFVVMVADCKDGNETLESKSKAKKVTLIMREGSSDPEVPTF
jgi:hypothetical protein